MKNKNNEYVCISTKKSNWCPIARDYFRCKRIPIADYAIMRLKGELKNEKEKTKTSTFS